VKQKIIVTGAGGNIGVYLARRLALAHDVIPVIHGYCPPGLKAARLDIGDAAAVAALIGEVRPDVVVHAAAMADANQCEQQPELARRVNVDGAANVARACRGAGAYLVHFSTDLVFDGTKGRYTEDDPPGPVSVYGRTKTDAERAVLEAAENAAVLRTAIVCGAGSGKRPNFFEMVLATVRRGGRMNIYTDEYRSFFNVLDAVAAAGALIEHRAEGIYHAGGERASRYEFTVRLLEWFGLETGALDPVRIKDAPGAAPRPADCSLVSDKLFRLTGWRPMDFYRSMRAFDESLRR